MKPRGDLIVPIRDRRQHRRLLTKRNVAGSGIALVLIFLVLTFAGEHRGTPRDYGRLFSSEQPKTETVTRRIEVVHEAPVGDQPAPAAAAVLIEPGSEVQPQPEQTTSVTESSVAIVGDSTGVEIRRPDGTKADHLRGGIFKPPIQ